MATWTPLPNQALKIPSLSLLFVKLSPLCPTNVDTFFFSFLPSKVCTLRINTRIRFEVFKERNPLRTIRFQNWRYHLLSVNIQSKVSLCLYISFCPSEPCRKRQEFLSDDWQHFKINFSFHQNRILFDQPVSNLFSYRTIPFVKGLQLIDFITRIQTESI